MNNEDLLVTNAFYPTLTLTDDNNEQKPGIQYNYSRPDVLPYKMENLGPFPEVNVRDERKYDRRTTQDFKQYLKKKEKILDDTREGRLSLGHSERVDQSNIPDKAVKDMPTAIGMGAGSGTSGTTGFIKKELGNDLLKFSNIDDTLDEKSDGNRVVRDTAYVINIDSRNRDGRDLKKTISGYSYSDLYFSYSYYITLPRPIRNVKMIEVKSSEIPFSVTSKFPYILLCINLYNIQPDTYNPYYKPDATNPYFPDPSTIPSTGTAQYNSGYLNNILNAGKVIPNPPDPNASNVTTFFTKIQLDGNVGQMLFNKHISLTTVYTNAVQEVYTVGVNFFNPDGTQYKVDDHSFTLEFISYTDSTSFTDISTRRGASDITIFNKILK